MSTPTRSGIIAAGNYIVDQVKIIDEWPAQESLANILGQKLGNGGGPYNLLKNLSKLGVDFRRAAAGLIGDDDFGQWIREDLEGLGVDTGHIQTTDAAPTSFTDVMTLQSSGRRTFFHQRGTNALIDESHIDLSDTSYKIFFLAYLLLLDRLDELREDGSTRFADVLKKARRAGFKTAVDAVSSTAPAFAQVVAASLPHIDYLFMNDYEAGRASGKTLVEEDRLDVGAAVDAGRALHARGDLEWIIIHAPEAAVAIPHEGDPVVQGAVRLPGERIEGATGAGDAFCTGVLYGLHEEHAIDTCLRTGVCVAASCLLDSTCSDGILPLDDCLALGEEYGYRR